MMEENKTGTSLQKQLETYAASDYYGFHMPGHKRRMRGLSNPYALDITEIYGFDDLHHPKDHGILAEAQRRGARLYGAEETHFLVNGSTGGILSAISACTRQGGELLMARNSHRSAYHGAGLRNLRLWYLYPQMVEKLWINGGILSLDVENALREHPGIEAVFLTSPTYEGICLDVRAAAEACHKRGVPLIVDQAHGAHFPFSSYFPEDALKAGADVVIQSLHKTLPALTQTALLHIQGELVDREKLRYYLSVYQTSSPSYVFMASIDSCLEQLEREGRTLFQEYTARLEAFRQGCRDLECLHLVGRELAGKAGVSDFDRSRLVISTEGTVFTGEDLMEYLRSSHHLELEMAAGHYAVGISSVADQEKDFMRLSDGLRTLDRLLQKQSGGRRAIDFNRQRLPKACTLLTIGTALEQKREWIEAGSCQGRIAGAYLYLYPPGIPLVVPGEQLTEEICCQIETYLAAGQELYGLGEDGRIGVIKEK